MRKNGLAIAAASGLALAAMVAVWAYGSRRSRPTPPPLPPTASAPTNPVPAQCEGRLGLDLEFHFPDREAPWQRGRSYEFELSLDGSKKLPCSFEVPVRAWYPEMGSLDCGFSLRPSGEPAGMSFSGSPQRIEVRVLSDSQVFYQGSVSPQYERVGESCILDTRIDLSSVEPGRN